MFFVRINYVSLIVFIGILVSTVTARAMEIIPRATLAMQYTDNARKVADNEESDLIVVTSVGATIDVGSGPFRLNADTSLKYTNYIQNTFVNKQNFSLNSTAGWEMVKDRFDWNLQNFFSQQSINSLDSDTPDNTQNINIFTFGPNINYRMSGRQSVTFKPEYRNFLYEHQNINNQQISLDANWNYQLFRTLNVGVRGGTNKVDYDDPVLTDNTFRNIHLTLAATRPRYNYSVDIGSTLVNREDGDSERGITGNMRWSFNMTRDSNLKTYIASDLTDANSSLLNASINPDDGDFSNEQTSSEDLRNTTFRLTYQRSDAKLSSNLWIELRKQKYEFALLDREVQAVGFELNYPLTAVLSTGINTNYSSIELTDVDRKDNQYSIGGNINYRLSRKLLGVLDLKYSAQDSTENTVDFNEMSLFVSLVYGYGS